MHKPKRFIIVGDNHGDMVCPVTSKAVYEFIKDFKPQVRIHGGDGFDLRALRHGASAEEKWGSLKGDWDCGSEFVSKLFQGGSENFYLEGNHCGFRLRELAQSMDGVHRDYATEALERFEGLIKGKYRAKMFPYDARLGILKYGHLKVIHGYFAGKNACARHAAVYGNVIAHHVHTIEAFPVESDIGPSEARQNGCCCTIDMHYNAKMPNKLRHRNGWMYGYLFEDGTYQVFNTMRIGDNFYAAKEIKEY